MLEHRILLTKAYWSMIYPEDFIFRPSMKKLWKKFLRKLTLTQRLQYMWYRRVRGIKFPNYLWFLHEFQVQKFDKKLATEREFDRRHPMYNDRMKEVGPFLEKGNYGNKLNFRDFIKVGDQVNKEKKVN